MNLKPLLVAAAALGVLATGIALAVDGGTDAVIQMVSFSILVVVAVGIADSKSSQMQGCQTILALLFAPLIGVCVAVFARFANLPMFDGLLAWAGAFRFTVLLLVTVVVAAAISGIAANRKRVGHAKRRGGDIVSKALGLGIVSGVAGLTWDLIGLALRQF